MKRNAWQLSALMLVAIGIVATAILVGNRMAVEQKAKSTEIMLDYQEIGKLAAQSEHDIEWWFERFHEMGVYSVAVPEETLTSLKQEGRDLDYGLVTLMQKIPNWEALYPTEIVEKIKNKEYKEHYLLVRIKEPVLKKMIAQGLESRYNQELYDFYNDDTYDYYVIKNRAEDVWFSEKETLVDNDSKDAWQLQRKPAMCTAELMGLGFDEEKVKLVKKTGLDIIPRSINYSAMTEKLVQAYKDDLKAMKVEPRVVLFQGKEVTGYPDRQSEMETFLKENNIAVGMVEDSVQRGIAEQKDLENLTRNINYNAVRVFSVLDYIQKRYKFYNYDGAEEIENTLYRAITERNIRLIYFKPFKYNDVAYVTNVMEYQKTFDSLKVRLQPHDMTIGTISVMPANTPRRLLSVAVTIGLWAIILLLLNQFIILRSRYRWGLMLLGPIGAAGAFKIAPGMSGDLAGIVAAVLFSSMGAWYFVHQLKKVYLSDEPVSFKKALFEGGKTLLVTSTLSLIAGLVIAGLLSSSEFLLEMRFFRGVKASQLVPLIAVAMVYIYEFGYRRSREEIKTQEVFPKDILSILFEDIKVYYVILAGIAGVIGMIYIARTGHETNIQPSDLEMIMRNALENVLLARPRNKEFLMAFPAIVASFVIARYHFKKLIFPVVVCGAVGLTSVPNTFSHLRTPVYLSVARTIYGVGFGFVIGVIGFAILWFLAYSLRKHVRSTSA